MIPTSHAHPNNVPCSTQTWQVAPALALSLCAIEAIVRAGWVRQADTRLSSIIPIKEGATLLDGLAALQL